MSLDNVSGGGKNNSVLESLRLNNTPKIDPKTEPQAETETSSAISKYINVSSNIVISTKVNKGSVPASTPATKDFIPNVNTPLVVGDHVFSNVRKLSEGMDVEEAKKVTKDNKIDEIIFKTEDDNLYIAYGSKEDKGSLKLDQVKEGYVGKFGNQTAKIISIDNEVNTVKEGALSPLKSTWASVKESGTTGITKGISEMGATLVAMFVGKALIQNGITAVSTTEGTVAVVTGATNAISTAKNIGTVVGETKKTGQVIISTMGSGAKQLAVGVVIAGVVVGGIAGSMSIYGAIAARNPKNDFTTIDMITDPALAFKDRKDEKKP